MRKMCWQFVCLLCVQPSKFIGWPGGQVGRWAGRRLGGGGNGTENENGLWHLFMQWLCSRAHVAYC